MRDLKKYTSYSIIKNIENSKTESRREQMLWMFKRAGNKNANNTHYQFWQQGNHPAELNIATIMQQKQDYIHNNPVEAGIVLSPEEYLYSSEKKLSWIKGVLTGCKINCSVTAV